MALADLDTRFAHHPPTPAQAEAHQEIRAAALALARLIDGLAPDSREKSLAVTHVEESVFWADAAIARN